MANKSSNMKNALGLRFHMLSHSIKILIQMFSAVKTFQDVILECKSFRGWCLLHIWKRPEQQSPSLCGVWKKKEKSFLLNMYVWIKRSILDINFRAFQERLLNYWCDVSLVVVLNDPASQEYAKSHDFLISSWSLRFWMFSAETLFPS